MISKNQIKYIKGLSLKKNRIKKQCFIVEGEKCLAELLNSSFEIVELFALKDWIDDNKHLLKPQVGNSVVYDQGDFMIMVVGGPNSRKDNHVDPIEEFFYQLEGDMLLKVIIDNKRVDIPIKEGEIFLLPKNVPHSPQRFEGTIGLVIEYKREE